MEKPTTESNGGSAVISDNEAAKAVIKFGDLSVGLQSLQVVNGGKQYLLNLTFSNKSAKKSMWVAFNSSGVFANKHVTIRDSNGFEFCLDGNNSSGVVSATVVKDIQFYANSAPAAPDRLSQATEIQPGNSVSVAAKFFSEQNRLATPGQCTVQMEILVSNDFNNGTGTCTTKNFSAKMDTE